MHCFESDIETAIIETTKGDSKTGSKGKKVSYYCTRYERDPSLRQAAIDFCRKKNGALICEACQTDYEERILRSFMEQIPGAVYQHRAIWDCKWQYSDSVYTSFEKAWADVMESWSRDEVPEIIVEKNSPR